MVALVTLHSRRCTNVLHTVSSAVFSLNNLGVNFPARHLYSCVADKGIKFPLCLTAGFSAADGPEQQHKCQGHQCSDYDKSINQWNACDGCIFTTVFLRQLNSSSGEGRKSLWGMSFDQTLRVTFKAVSTGPADTRRSSIAAFRAVVLLLPLL